MTEQFVETSPLPVQPVLVEPKKKKPWPKIAILAFLVLLLAGGGLYISGLITRFAVKPCSTEAMVCPDGSSVWRTGPNCELAPCPIQIEPRLEAEEIDNKWQTYRHGNLTFKYPSNWAEKPLKLEGHGVSTDTQEIVDPGGQYWLTLVGSYNGEKETDLEMYLDLPYKSPEVLMAGGRTGVQVLPRAGSENINKVVFFSEDETVIYSLELRTGNTALDTSEEEVNEGKKIFDQILATIKFDNLDPDTALILTGILSGYKSVNFGPEKKGIFTVVRSPYRLDGYYNDENLYELLNDTPYSTDKPEDQIVYFAKSRKVNLGSFVGQKVSLRYRHALGMIIAEQQMVIVDAVE